MMQHNEQTVDVVVIGLGPGGEEVASRLVEAGLSVVGVEQELVGGECPYWGCVPSKMIIRTAETLAEARRVPVLAGAAAVQPDFAAVARRIRAEATDDWDDTVAVERFEKLGGQFVRGTAVIEAPGRVRVGERVFTTARGVVLASGSTPVIPPIPGLADVPHWTNREAIGARRPPPSLVVLGGGAIGLELAQAFARFGSTVTVVEAADRLLPAEEPEAGQAVAATLTAESLGVRSGRRAVAAPRSGGRTGLELDDGTTVRGTHLLVAVGRRPNVRGLGLAAYGLDPEARAVPVDGQLRAAGGLWAVGDVTGVGAFTPSRNVSRGIRVNGIGPGATVTSINRPWIDDPVKREMVEAHIPKRRAGGTEEMAAVTAFLCSDEAAYITGQTLFVDGGLTLYRASRRHGPRNEHRDRELVAVSLRP